MSKMCVANKKYILHMKYLFKLVLLLGLEPRLTSNLEFGIISPVVLHYTTGAFGVTDWNRTSIKEFCRLLHNYSATVTKW